MAGSSGSRRFPIDGWFDLIASVCALADAAARQLLDLGFVVVPGPAAVRTALLAATYDAGASTTAQS